jgi:hypothetical protein
MAFTGVSFIRSVRFRGGYTFILLQSIAYPSAGSERTYVIDGVLQGRLPDNFVGCFDIDVSLILQIHNKLSLLYLTLLKLSISSGLSDADVGIPAWENHFVPIKCLTFAELRHHAVLNRSHLLPSKPFHQYRYREYHKASTTLWSSCFETQTRQLGL